MQHPSTSTVWTYQTEDEQETLLDLYDQFVLAEDALDQLREQVRRVRGRAFMRRLNGVTSFSFDYYQPFPHR